MRRAVTFDQQVGLCHAPGTKMNVGFWEEVDIVAKIMREVEKRWGMVSRFQL